MSWLLPTASAIDILPSCAASGNCEARHFLELFVNLYKLGLELLAPVAVLFFVIGGITLLTAAGYQERIKKGQQILSQTTAGVIIVLLSWVIIDTVVFTLTGEANRTVFGTPWYQGSIWNPACEPIFREGCEDSDVTVLQNQLISLGYSVGASGADGRFGTDTTDAVARFQADYNGKVLTRYACSACGSFDQTSATIWGMVFDRLYGENPCGPRTAGESETIWCALPACTVTTQAVNEKRLTSDGSADEPTRAAVEQLQPVAELYRTICLSG